MKMRQPYRSVCQPVICLERHSSPIAVAPNPPNEVKVDMDRSVPLLLSSKQGDWAVVLTLASIPWEGKIATAYALRHWGWTMSLTTRKIQMYYVLCNTVCLIPQLLTEVKSTRDPPGIINLNTVHYCIIARKADPDSGLWWHHMTSSCSKKIKTLSKKRARMRGAYNL